MRLSHVQRLVFQEIEKKLEATKKDYSEIELRPNSVIYCDIPYRGTEGYNTEEGFNYEDFYEWCNEQKELVLISEYNMPSDRFIEVWHTNKQAIFSQNYNKTITERLFVPIKQYNEYQALMLQDKQIREREGQRELSLFD